MASGPIQTLTLCGGGLSLWMTAAALSRSLPDTIKITIVEMDPEPVEDAFYGQILPPEAYAFHLSIGLSEPELLLNTETTFALGTHVRDWAGRGQSWVQVFHQPLLILDGVPLAKLIQQTPDRSLQDTLISAQAVLHGVFAHPPEDPEHPLSRAEYGYAFAPRELTALYKAVSLKRSIHLIRAGVDQIDRNSAGITALTLSDGQRVSADLFIECSGPDAVLQPTTSSGRESGRTLHALISHIGGAPLGAPARTVLSGEHGWQSEVALRSGISRITICHPDSESHARTVHDVDPDSNATFHLGYIDAAWTSNYIAIGQTASAFEPITTAPIKLLLRDIERLINLFPVTSDMRIEAQEYNRLFREDVCHADIFNQAHFALPDLPHAPYWQSASASPQHPKLSRKLVQYESRGHLVAYDHEPFDDVDWAVLHDGLGRKPKRRDPLASLAEPAMVQAKLESLEQSIQSAIGKMPPHSIYMSKFLSYLHRKYSCNG